MDINISASTGWVYSVGFNHDGNKIAFDRGIIQYVYGMLILVNGWNIERSYRLCQSVVFNHDGTKDCIWIVDKTIRVWNVDTGECILTL